MRVYWRVVHYILTIYSLYVHYMFTIYSLYFSLYLHYMFTMYSLHVHYIFTTCSPFGGGVYFTFPFPNTCLLEGGIYKRALFKRGNAVLDLGKGLKSEKLPKIQEKISHSATFSCPACIIHLSLQSHKLVYSKNPLIRNQILRNYSLIHYMFTICSLYIHYIFTVCSL